MLQPTPLPVSGYSRYVGGVFDEKKLIGVPTLFQTILSGPNSVVKYSPDANIIDIDILRGHKEMAKLILRGTQARNIGQKNTNVHDYSKITRKFPLIEIEGDIDSSQLMKVLPGTNPYDLGKSQHDKLRYLAAEIHADHVVRIVRLCEVLASKAVITGKHDAIFGTTNVDLQYDFLRDASNTITVSVAWNGTTPDIMGDLDAACDKVRQNGNVTADVAIVGEDAMSYLVADSTVASLADNRRFELVKIGTEAPSHLSKLVEGGAIYRGVIYTPKGNQLYLFTYLDEYTDYQGALQKIMPVDKTVVLASKMQAGRYYGPNDNLPSTPSKEQWMREMFGFGPELGMGTSKIKNSNIISPAQFYFDAYIASNGSKGVTLRTQSAPIFAPNHTDAIATLNGLKE